MSKHASLALTLLALLALQDAALARGRGTYCYLVTADGQLAASLGETRSDLLDPQGFVRYRYHEGRVTAVPLDKPDTVLWSAPAKPQSAGLAPLWKLTPDVLVIFGEDSITGLERTSGKALYSTTADGFTRSPYYMQFASESDTPPAPTLYLIDVTAQQEQVTPTPTVPARLARFDLRSGKFLWKTSIITAAGRKIRPSEIDPHGCVQGQQMDDEFYFDVATGKALDKAPANDNTAEPRDVPQRAQTSPDKIEYHDAEGRLMWSRVQPGEKGTPLRAGETLLVPTVTDRSTVSLVALNIKDGAQRWKLALPQGPFADSVTVDVQPAKSGYLVQVHWLVLD